jgi:V/A-type H+-transporting ATPase subunit E
MAMEEVAKDILDKASKEADLRIQAAENERAKILQEADLKIENMRKAEEKELQDNLARMRRQEVSSAELEAKKIVLNKRKEILNKTFEETLSELTNMSPHDKSALYKKILTDEKKTIHRPKVFCPKGEADLLAGLRGCECLTEMDMSPGLILENEDGSVRLDYRFKTILETIWDRELKTVSNMLFE